MLPLTIVNLLSEGDIPYGEALERQRDTVAKRQRNEIGDTLLLLRHPPTVTFGKNSRPENFLLDADGYESRGIELVASDRGGDVTYHGPGQLIGYPILHLGEGRRDVHRYVRSLEEVLIGVAHEFGIVEANRAPWHAGIWVGDGYLAALGVRISRWVTLHGFALNVTGEVREGFSTIVPCGVAEKSVATLSGCAGKSISLFEAAASVERHFSSVFDYYESMLDRIS